MRDSKSRKLPEVDSGRVNSKRVTSKDSTGVETIPNPSDLLFSSDSEDGEEVRQIQVVDEGSRSQLAHVVIEGVHADGIIDTGADITIMVRSFLLGWRRLQGRAKLLGPTTVKPFIWMGAWIWTCVLLTGQ